MAANPLSQGNWLQRRYYAWAAPYYARMAPQMREQAELIDCFLYSRRGIGVWAGAACAAIGCTWGLIAAGLPLLLALGLSLLLLVSLPLGALAAWLQPERFDWPRLRKTAPVVVAMAFLGALVGFVVGHIGKHGGLDLEQLLRSLVSALALVAPILLLAMLGFVALLWGVAQIRRQIIERELERVTLAGERDAAARQAAEARLQLLNAQIQPHFIFNTLSALQHWVDSADPRAGPLLRSLTAFLRGSTELLGRDEAALRDEAEMAGHYLAIQQARLGHRLQWRMQIAPEVAAELLPPGLLLSLIENAVEHGIAPALGGGSVNVQARNDGSVVTICVEDTGVGLAPGWQDGVGLANCRARLAHRFGQRASLSFEPLHPGTRARIAFGRTSP